MPFIVNAQTFRPLLRQPGKLLLVLRQSVTFANENLDDGSGFAVGPRSYQAVSATVDDTLELLLISHCVFNSLDKGVLVSQ
jgi:hypothetical protein